MSSLFFLPLSLTFGHVVMWSACTQSSLPKTPTICLELGRYSVFSFILTSIRTFSADEVIKTVLQEMVLYVLRTTAEQFSREENS